MEWSNKDCLELIGSYERHNILWDTRHHLHNSKIAKQEAWISIARELNIDIEEIRKKINSLLGSFRRERSKARNSLGVGKDPQKVYVSKWFAFDRMHFLLERRDGRHIYNNDNTTEPNQEENEPVEIKTEQETNADERLSIGELAMEYQNKEMQKNIQEKPAPVVVEQENHTERRHLKRKAYEEPRLNEILRIIKTSVTAASAITSMDECSVYGQHIANKLRSYSAKTRTMVEHNINNELFKADLGEYDGFCSNSKDESFYPSFSYQEANHNSNQSPPPDAFNHCIPITFEDT